MTTHLSPHDVELLLTRNAVQTSRADLADLADLLDTLEADLRPAHVEPSGELLALLAGDRHVAAPPAAAGGSPRLRLLAKVASAGVGAKFAFGAAAAAAAVVAAGWGGALPAPVQDIVDRVLVPPEDTPDSVPRPDSQPQPQPVQRRLTLTPAPSPDQAGSHGPATGSSDDDQGHAVPAPPGSSTGPVNDATPNDPGTGGSGSPEGQNEDTDDEETVDEGTGDETGDEADDGQADDTDPGPENDDTDDTDTDDTGGEPEDGASAHPGNDARGVGRFMRSNT